MPSLIGNKPTQVPTNGDLGTLAFQDASNVIVGNVNATGVTTVQAGTVSAPAITTTGDTNTGIFFPAADTIAFTEGGVESMRIDSSGNVGVGTTSPALKFHVNSGAAGGVASFQSTATVADVSLVDSGTTSGQVRLRSTSNALAFLTDTTERMRISSTGDVGIGTNSPSSRLHVLTSSPFISIFASSDATNSYVAFRYNTSATFGYIGNGSGLAGGSSTDLTVRSEANLVFASSGANERMRITSAGNVGIGTSSPSAKLSLSGASELLRLSNDNAFISYYDSANSTRRGYIQYGATGAFFILDLAQPMVFSTSGAERMRIDSSGYVLIGTTSNPAAAQLMVTKAGGAQGFEFLPGNTTTKNLILNYNRATSAYLTSEINALDHYWQTSGTERMRIDASGNLLVGTTVGGLHRIYKSSSNDLVLDIANTSATGPYGTRILFTAATPNNTTQYFLECADSTNVKCTIYSSGTISNRTGTYNTISDVKLKENIVDATPKLDKLMQTRVVNYNLIGDELKQIGFVAQELETVFPALIDNVPDLDENKQPTGEVTKGVKLTVMIPILVKAIQEQQTLIENLTTRLNALEGK